MITTNIIVTNSVAVTNVVITNWTTTHGLKEEIKVATVKTTAGPFTNGETFFGTGVDGQIGWMSADGSVVLTNWILLTNSFHETLFRGGFYVDQSGRFDHDLIAVTGDTFDLGGEVWRIHSRTNAVLLAAITNTSAPHLEGVTVLTNLDSAWGPWTGRIITGSESTSPPLVRSINTNGEFASFAIGIEPEDFDVVPQGQDLYVPDPITGRVLRLPQIWLTNFVNQILITQAGEFSAPPKIFIVKWDGASFVKRSIPHPEPAGPFEHISFAPISIPSIQ